MRLRNLSAVCAATLLMATMGLMVRAQGAAGGAAGGGAGGGQGAGGQRRGGRGGRGVQIAQVPVSVLGSELKLTADQKTKIQTIQDTLADTLKKAQTPGATPDFQAMRATYTQANTDIEAVLTEDQKAKLPDMYKSLGVYTSVGIQLGVLPALKLTEDEKTKIAAIATDAQTKMTEARQNAQGGDRQAAFTAMQAIRKDASDKVVALLTDSQKATLEAYNKAHPAPTFGPGGPGGQRQQRQGA